MVIKVWARAGAGKSLMFFGEHAEREAAALVLELTLAGCEVHTELVA